MDAADGEGSTGTLILDTIERELLPKFIDIDGSYPKEFIRRKVDFLLKDNEVCPCVHG